MFTIREAALSDAPVLCLMNRETLGYDYPEEETRERLSQILSLPGNRIFVAEVDGEAAGYIHAADYVCLYADPLKNILALAVAKKHQGKGIGKALLEACEDWARSESCSGVRVVSGAGRTRAHGFYAHCGYVLRKEQKNFIKPL